MANTVSEVERVFDRITARVSALPQQIATLAVNFSKERFVEKNWHDSSPEPWPKTNKRKGSTLISSGRLKRSIRKIHVSPDYISIGTDVPYAKIHNEGGEISGVETVKSHNRRAHKRRAHTRKGKRIKKQTVKAHGVKSYGRKYFRKFKKRQFIGKSQELESRAVNLINTELDNAIRSG
jgi:phage gpG-like protein